MAVSQRKNGGGIEEGKKTSLPTLKAFWLVVVVVAYCKDVQFVHCTV